MNDIESTGREVVGLIMRGLTNASEAERDAIRLLRGESVECCDGTRYLRGRFYRPAHRIPMRVMDMAIRRAAESRRLRSIGSAATAMAALALSSEAKHLAWAAWGREGGSVKACLAKSLDAMVTSSKLYDKYSGWTLSPQTESTRRPRWARKLMRKAMRLAPWVAHIIGEAT